MSGSLQRFAAWVAIPALGLLAACNSGAHAPPPAPERPAPSSDAPVAVAPAGTGSSAHTAGTDDLARKLVARGYRELFLRMDRSEAKALWSSSRPELEALIRDPAADHQARFLAAEISFVEQPGFPPPDLRAVLAPLYAEAMAQTSRTSGTWQLMANQWGLLYQGDSVGELGTHLLALGSDAVAALRPLLGNAEHVLYEGSRNATTGNARMYRVKDIAAYYLGRLANHPVTFHDDLAARDREIDRLAKAVP